MQALGPMRLKGAMIIFPTLLLTSVGPRGEATPRKPSADLQYSWVTGARLFETGRVILKRLSSLECGLPESIRFASFF